MESTSRSPSFPRKPRKAGDGVHRLRSDVGEAAGNHWSAALASAARGGLFKLQAAVSDAVAMLTSDRTASPDNLRCISRKARIVTLGCAVREFPDDPVTGLEAEYHDEERGWLKFPQATDDSPADVLGLGVAVFKVLPEEHDTSSAQLLPLADEVTTREGAAIEYVTHEWELELTGLSPDVVHRVRVAGVRQASGCGQFSECQVPVLAPLKWPPIIRVAARLPYTVSVVWDEMDFQDHDPDTQVSECKLEWCLEASKDDRSFEWQASAAQRHVDLGVPGASWIARAHDLQPQTRYLIRVFSRNLGGWGRGGVTLSVKTARLAAAPADVRCVETQVGAVKIQFKALAQPFPGVMLDAFEVNQHTSACPGTDPGHIVPWHKDKPAMMEPGLPYVAGCVAMPDEDTGNVVPKITGIAESETKEVVWHMLVKGLMPGEDYWFSVAGLRGGLLYTKESVPSLFRCATRPDVPRGLCCVARRPQSLALDWLLVDPEGAPVTECEVRIREAQAFARWMTHRASRNASGVADTDFGGNAKTDASDISVLSPKEWLAQKPACRRRWTYTVHGLKPVSSYVVQVRAKNAVAWSEFAPHVEKPVSTSDVPPPPTKVVKTSYGVDFIEMSWEVVNPRGAPVTAAVLETKPGRAFFWEALALTTGAAAGATPTGRPQLVYCKEMHRSEGSQDLREALHNDVVDAVDGPREAEISTDYDQGTSTLLRLSTSTWRARVCGLDPRTNYQFRICAVNAAGRGDPSVASANTMEAPAAPRNVVCTAREPTSLTMSFEVLVPSDSAVDACELQYHRVGGFAPSWESMTILPPEDQGEGRPGAPAEWHVAIGGLEPGTKYVVRVRAQNAAGLGDTFSKEAEFSTPSCPETPTLFEIASTSTSLSIGVDVADPEDCPVACCEIEIWRADGQGRGIDKVLITQRSVVGGPAWRTRILALPPGIRFICRARAVNSAGWGARSKEIHMATDAALDAAESRRTGSTAFGNVASVETKSRTANAVEEAGLGLRSEGEDGAGDERAKVADAIPAALRPIGTEASTRPLRIMCLDGGGIKGLNIVWAIEALQRILGGRVPWERYDLIAGNSIGGIMATDIAAGLRSTSTEFEELMWVLHREHIATCRTLDRMTKGYGISRESIRQLMENSCPKGAAYNFPFVGGIPCFVVTCQCNPIGTSSPFLVRNYPKPAREEELSGEPLTSGCYGTWTQRDAKAATAAAPTFVQRHIRIDDEEDTCYYMDGVLYANNPSSLAIHEAQRLWPGREIGCVHSLGCGRTRTRNEWGHDDTPGDTETLSTTMERIAQAAFDSSFEHRRAVELLKLSNPSARFIRIDPPASRVQPFDSDVEELANMRLNSLSYLGSKRTQKELRSMVADLGIRRSTCRDDLAMGLPRGEEYTSGHECGDHTALDDFHL